MAPLKRLLQALFGQCFGEYPWLRGHGSIEAQHVRQLVRAVLIVSMAERSWLH